MLARVSGAYLFGQQKHGPSNSLVKSRVPSQGGFPLERNSWSHEGFVTRFAGSHYWITDLLLSTHTCLTAFFSGTTRVSRYQKGKTNLDFTEARDSERQWRQLGHMQICTSLQTDNHASTPPLSFLQAGCPSCHPTNSVKALKANLCRVIGMIVYLGTETA